jgi:hypothetical protein
VEKAKHCTMPLQQFFLLLIIITQMATYSSLFDQQPGLFVISLRLLNLRLHAAGYTQLYRLSPLRSSYVKTHVSFLFSPSLSLSLSLSSTLLTSTQRKTVGAFVEIDVSAVPGLFQYFRSLDNVDAKVKQSMERGALERAGIRKGKRGAANDTISGANQKMEQLYNDKVTPAQKKLYKRPTPRVRAKLLLACLLVHSGPF